MDIWRIYTDAVHQQFKKFFATWIPGERVAIGDVGYLDHSRFIRKGTLGNFGLDIPQQKRVPGDQHIQLQSARGLAVSASASSASVPPELKLKFSHHNAVFLNLIDCTHQSIALLDLQSSVLDLVRAGIWNPDLVIVTSVVGAKAATIACAGNADSEVTLKSNLPAAALDFADPNLQLSVAIQNRCGLLEPNLRDCTPLMGLAQVRRRLRGQELMERALAATGEESLNESIAMLRSVRAGGSVSEILELASLDD
jgi:hypothetical protein